MLEHCLRFIRASNSSRVIPATAKHGMSVSDAHDANDKRHAELAPALSASQVMLSKSTDSMAARAIVEKERDTMVFG
jgi:hypothetical protein